MLYVALMCWYSEIFYQTLPSRKTSQNQERLFTVLVTQGERQAKSIPGKLAITHSPPASVSILFKEYHAYIFWRILKCCNFPVITLCKLPKRKLVYNVTVTALGVTLQCYACMFDDLIKCDNILENNLITFPVNILI